ncbi:MAG: twin-arginine translocase subunit TatC [Clostridia bacterium]|nr:twin-arginine translocase subunit TatC [Clostridia bacterium]
MKDRREDQALPLMGHLLAFRKTLIVSIGAVVAAFFLVYALAADPLMAWIVQPIQRRGIEIIYTALSEALVTKFKVALIAACVLASPVVIGQVWAFVKPALYEGEKRKARILFWIAVLLFLLGVSFCYFAIYTLAIDFFLVQGENLASPMLSIDKYVSFMFGFIVPFGVAFLLPVALYVTTKAGLTNHRMLASKRKFVLLGIFVIAAILTPPDVVSQVALGVPLYLLYEISIQVARMTKPRDAMQA